MAEGRRHVSIPHERTDTVSDPSDTPEAEVFSDAGLESKGPPKAPPLETAEVPIRPRNVGRSAILRVLRVPPEHAGTRMDVFVQSQLRNTSRTRASAIVRRSAFTLDGRPLRPSARLSSEDRIALWRPPFDEEVTPLALTVLYEDAHLLVIDKPPLIAVHPTARYYRSTVIKRLEAQRPGEFLSLVHRLDRETSGVLMLARTREADRAFKMMLEDRSMGDAASPRGRRKAPSSLPDITKVYLAITWGVPSDGLIDCPLEPDTDNPLRVKMRVARPNTGQEARTTLSLLQQQRGYALVSCELHTGRQHQIRAHLASLACPVVGDKLYGPDDRLLARAADGRLTEEDWSRLELPRHALHSHRYTLPHAITGEELNLVSPLPPDLVAFWNALGSPTED